jgi:oligosaccharyltransferase complex subunit alpha (ribophorin I)
MKPLALATALLSLAASAVASSSADAPRAILPPSFKPAQVFKNVNLVHIISLEKSYVKESINVLVENIASEPQDEYLLPFTASQISRVGGLEVKDRKDDNVGPFRVEEVKFDDNRYV